MLPLEVINAKNAVVSLYFYVVVLSFYLELREERKHGEEEEEEVLCRKKILLFDRTGNETKVTRQCDQIFEPQNA